jgi:hypothetical protein
LIIGSGKAGGQAGSGWKYHGNFESRSHLLVADKPVNRGMKVAPCFGIGKFCDRFGSLGNADGSQKITLCYGPYKASATICCGSTQSTEINPMRQIGLSWLVKHFNRLVIGNGLQTIATWPITPIIND